MYMTNNVMLHSRNRKNKANLQDRISAHRDLVFQQTLLRSTLVKHVVEAYNRVEGNSGEAIHARQRILSLIARDFPYKVLKTLPWRVPDKGTKLKNRSLTEHMETLEDICRTRYKQ